MPLWNAMTPASRDVTSRIPVLIPAHGQNSSTIGANTKVVESPDSRVAPAASTTCVARSS